MTKKCCKCKNDLDLEAFGKDKKTKDGLGYSCKACNAEAAREKRASETEEDKAKRAATWQVYYETNKKALSEKAKIRRAENPEKIKAQRVVTRAKSRDKDREYGRKRRLEFPELVKEQRDTYRKKYPGREYQLLLLKPQSKLAKRLRTRLFLAVKNDWKSGSAVGDLGCSVEELKTHIESKFVDGMTWENWGVGPGKWHIDHIAPLAAFDLEDRQHLVLACHYLNLRPLWSEENLAKSDKFPFEMVA